MRRYPKGMSVVPIKGFTIVRLYNTNILTIDHQNETIQFETGGWHTKHTKKCMNLILRQYNLYVRQKNFKWYIESQNETVPFIDGYKHNITKAA